MRVILVPLVGDDHDRAALAAACTIARPFGGHVAGLFVRPDLVDVIADFEGGSQEVLAELERATTTRWDQDSARARRAFGEAVKTAGLQVAEQPGEAAAVTASWREATGAAEEMVPRVGRLADLIVFAGINADGQRRKAFEGALVGAARPLLLVPPGGAEHFGRTVAIAWDGSVEATRALLGALPLLKRAAEVHVLTAPGAGTAVEQAAALAAYLAWHELSARQHALYPKASVGVALLAKAKELGADLLVMGGYGHSRVRELIFGGATRHILHYYDLPVLIAH
jgi:nucleotide-binding universal stress UspA family protein